MKKTPLKSQVFIEILSDYKTYLNVKNYAERVKYNYLQPVHDFLSFLEKKGVKDINFTREEVTAYYEYLCHRPNRRGGVLSQKSINDHLTALNKLFQLLLDTGKAETLPALPNFVRGHYTHRSILTVEEIKYLYSICENKREKAIISLAYGCGLRKGEILALKLADVALRSSLLIVRAGKNNKRREVPLSDTVKADLRAYLLEERPHALMDNGKPELSFLLSKWGVGIGANSLYRSFKKILKRSEMASINEKEVSLHNLRHSIATHLAEAGAAIEFIQSFLGHTSMDTSQLYAIRRKRNTQL